MKTNKKTLLLLPLFTLVLLAGAAWHVKTPQTDDTSHIIAAIKSNEAKGTPAGDSTTSAPSAAGSSSRSSAAHTANTSASARPAAIAIMQAHGIVTSEGQHFPIRKYSTLMTPNDPNATQWWTTTENLSTLWNIPAPGYTPMIAIIDTGFGLSHEELANRWALNSGEQGATTSENPSVRNCTDRGLALDESCNLIDDDHDGIVDDESGPTTIENPSRLNCTDQGKPLDKSCNLIDDDGNGYVDDYRGWDFAYGDNNPQAGQIDPSGQGTTHATMVSGVAAATGNNGVGIAGVNWQAKILPLEALDDEGSGDTLTVANAVTYAADRHADIINLSLGTSADDPYLRSAIDYAVSQGSIVIAAAGNSGCDCISYPANYPEVVAVGSLSPSGTLSSFSSFGNNLDVLAPGENITTSSWSAAYPTNGYVSGAAGTSFASPIVSGILATLKSEQPTATNGELIAALKETADHKTLTASQPHSATLGFGVANAGAAAIRMSTAASPIQRYGLGPDSTADPLGSSRVDACLDGTFPSTELFELSNGSSYTYTMSELEVANAASNGLSVRSLGYQCVGQVQDRPQSLRDINLNTEIH